MDESYSLLATKGKTGVTGGKLREAVGGENEGEREVSKKDW